MVPVKIGVARGIDWGRVDPLQSLPKIRPESLGILGQGAANLAELADGQGMIIPSRSLVLSHSFCCFAILRLSRIKVWVRAACMVALRLLLGLRGFQVPH